MDVYNMYVGDCSYTPRHSVFRDYERFPYGSLERNSNPQKSYYDKVQGIEKVTKKCVKCKCEKDKCKCLHKGHMKMLPTNAFRTSILE